MIIFAEIEGIEYDIKMPEELMEFSFLDFDINEIQTQCLLKEKKFNLAISKWASPQPTRNDAFESVYNTLSFAKKIAIIPVIKDEGEKRYRDFLQWDTISLISLFEVYVIFAYHHKAEKHPKFSDRILNLQIDNNYILQKIRKLRNYHSSALHWNLKEIKESVPVLIDKAINFYSELTNKYNIKFHNELGLERFQKQFENDINTFYETMREDPIKLHFKENQTVKTRKNQITETNVKINIKNYLGGIYQFKVSEVEIKNNFLYLIESTYSKIKKIPSLSDIKAALLKIMVYCNLSKVKIDNKLFVVIPVLKIHSTLIKGEYRTGDSEKQKSSFMAQNKFHIFHTYLINWLIMESDANKFEILIQGKRLKDNQIFDSN